MFLWPLILSGDVGVVRLKLGVGISEDDGEYNSDVIEREELVSSWSLDTDDS